MERPLQEVWLYLRQMELWKGLGSFDLLQLVHLKLSGCAVFAERALVSWPDLSIMSQFVIIITSILNLVKRCACKKITTGKREKRKGYGFRQTSDS